MQSWQQSAGVAGLQKTVTACRNSACPSPTHLQGCIRKFSVLRNPPKCPPSLPLSCGAVAGEAEPNASLSISTQAHCCCSHAAPRGQERRKQGSLPQICLLQPSTSKTDLMNQQAQLFVLPVAYL